MNIVVCGLNSYLGKASLHYLVNDSFQVHGLVRDQELLISKLKAPTSAKLYNVDIVRYNPYGLNITIPDCKVAFYFTQTPELYDIVGANYELLSIRNFIHFAKRNNCNRIVYVGTIYDRRYLSAIQQLFEELEVTYTIVLKDVAVGKGTAFEEFVYKMLKNRFIYLYKPTDNVSFNPIRLKDLMSWLATVDWNGNYINQYVQFQGPKKIEIEEVIGMYEQLSDTGKKHKIIPIHNKRIANILNKYLAKVPYEMYAQHIAELSNRDDLVNVETVNSNSIQSSELIL